jgi:hypothetical protein
MEVYSPSVHGGGKRLQASTVLSSTVAGTALNRHQYQRADP